MGYKVTRNPYTLRGCDRKLGVGPGYRQDEGYQPLVYKARTHNRKRGCHKSLRLCSRGSNNVHVHPLKNTPCCDYCRLPGHDGVKLEL